MSAGFIGQNLSKFGRKNSILLGYVFITLASLCFGLLKLVSNDTLFFALAIVIRFVTGIADALVTVAVYSVVTYEYPKQREQYIGYTEAALGLGMMMGPVMGSMLFGTLRYEWTFITLGCILGVCALIMWLLLPNRINKPCEKENELEE